MELDLGLRSPDLDQLPGSDLAGRHRVEVAAEGDQAVLADWPQMPLGHQIRSQWQGLEGRVDACRALSDDLLVSPVGLGPSLRDPGGEGGAHLLDG